MDKRMAAAMSFKKKKADDGEPAEQKAEAHGFFSIKAVAAKPRCQSELYTPSDHCCCRDEQDDSLQNCNQQKILLSEFSTIGHIQQLSDSHSCPMRRATPAATIELVYPGGGSCTLPVCATRPAAEPEAEPEGESAVSWLQQIGIPASVECSQTCDFTRTARWTVSQPSKIVLFCIKSAVTCSEICCAEC